MSYRIVHNELTSRYRVEKLGFFGWNFVADPDGGGYLSFTDAGEARTWICKKTRPGADAHRRWKVITDCDV